MASAKRGAKTVGSVGMALAALLILFPVYILVTGAIRPATDGGDRLLPPGAPTLDNFVRAWQTADLGSALLTSVAVTGISVVILVVLASAASYPLARLTRTWSNFAYYGFMVGFLLPFQLALLPLYTTFRDLGLLGSPVTLVILYAGLQMPFSIFLYVEFIRSVPREYDEAAEMDGCNHLLVFWHVILPMVRPITGTVIILNVVSIWNDFYAPLLYLSGSGMKTLPLAIYQFTGEFGAQWELLFSALILGSIPVLLAFFVMQKSVFRGYASGLKG
jgi:raffinose/stachyose/melibiose transport system permease protein